MSSIIDLLIELIKNMSVVIILAYILTRTRAYVDIMSTEKATFRQKLCLILVFGVFSIFGTLSGININGAICNIRDMGPAIAGLIGGPIVGIGAGLIGGIHRFMMGGITYIPCSISTVVAGIAGGLIYHYRKGRFIGITAAVVFMALMETFHMCLTLIIVKPFSTILPIVQSISLPMIFTNSLGMGIFMFIVSNLMKERETQRNEELIEGELSAATCIQSSMLPSIFPAFPDRIEFDIYATMTPAKEVGGDFYDFFLVDDDHLAIVIADVSGKGVPAALFMVITKTLIKNCAVTGVSPKEVLEKVNDLLFESNEAEMFVTVWLGILELSTGKLKYANAGHENPLLIRNGKCEYVVERHGFVLAGMNGTKYQQFEIMLKPGDALFQYTDGVTEATDAGNHLYGAERLIETVRRNASLAPNELLPAVKKDIDAFVGDNAQFDDITMLGLVYQGGPLRKITVRAKTDELDGITEFVSGILKKANCSNKIQNKINMAIDEVFSNICNYSGSEFAEISCGVVDKVIELVFVDGGIPYNPLKQEPPDTTLSAEDRELGGLGIYMVKKSVDRLEYEYQEGKNILTLYQSIQS